MQNQAIIKIAIAPVKKVGVPFSSVVSFWEKRAEVIFAISIVVPGMPEQGPGFPGGISRPWEIEEYDEQYLESRSYNKRPTFRTSRVRHGFGVSVQSARSTIQASSNPALWLTLCQTRTETQAKVLDCPDFWLDLPFASRSGKSHLKGLIDRFYISNSFFSESLCLPTLDCSWSWPSLQGPILCMSQTVALKAPGELWMTRMLPFGSFLAADEMWLESIAIESDIACLFCD